MRLRVMAMRRRGKFPLCAWVVLAVSASTVFTSGAPRLRGALPENFEETAEYQAFARQHLVDEDRLFRESSFPISPKELLHLTKEFLLTEGRAQCGATAVDLAQLLGKALTALAEHESAAAMMVYQAILRPCLNRLPRNASIDKAVQAINEAVAGTGSIKPLTLFEEGAVQIKMLDPIFHEEGDRPMKRGMEVSETKQLQRRLNHERRQAARQLARDAAVVQQLQHQKGEVKRKAKQSERKRVRQMMETEKQELKKMATEFDKSMNTTFGSFSKTKERKKANRRMAGNATAENPKQPKEKKEKKDNGPMAAAKSDAPKTSKKSTKGGKRKARRL